MTAFTDSIVEEAVLDWLRELGLSDIRVVGYAMRTLLQKGKSFLVSTGSGSASGFCAS